VSEADEEVSPHTKFPPDAHGHFCMDLTFTNLFCFQPCHKGSKDSPWTTHWQCRSYLTSLHYELMPALRLSPQEDYDTSTTLHFTAQCSGLILTRSHAITKMTARCAPYIACVLWNFLGVPAWLRTQLIFPTFLMDFCSDLSRDCAYKIWSS